jgi:hypothetical protein
VIVVESDSKRGSRGLYTFSASSADEAIIGYPLLVCGQSENTGRMKFHEALHCSWDKRTERNGLSPQKMFRENIRDLSA